MEVIFSQKKFEQQLGYLEQSLLADFTAILNLAFWQDTRCVEDQSICTDPTGPKLTHRQLPPADAQWRQITTGTTWSGRDDYYWLKFTVPIVTKNEATVVHLDLGRTGDGNNFGFEGLVYVDGQEYQAVDSNHEEIFLSPTQFDGNVELQVALWTGLEGGGPQRSQTYALKTLSLGPQHRELRCLYRYMVNIVELLPELREDDPLLYSYRRLIQTIFTGINWREGVTSDQVQSANALIQKFIANHATEKPNFKVAAVGHTHIDVAWLWRYRHTREKAVRSFNTALRLMSEDPDFRFFYSSPQVYAFVQQDDPELMTRVQAQIDAGRWEPDGATWLEPDTNVPSGEALTRQFLYGMHYFRNKLHVNPDVLWLPDVFGYSYALPQIMQGFGIKNFVTSKIGWNETDRMPHDTFSWIGLDGSQVLTHFITTAERNFDYSEHKVWKYTYNGELTPKVLLTTYREYKDKQINNELLIPYGFGDGGGGTTREMVANLHVMNELPGLPHVASERVDDFFDELHQRLNSEPNTIPEWNGELYLEFHRGTYTSQGFVKQQNRRLEFALRNLEIIATTAVIRRKVKYPKASIDQLWQLVLRNQFHDVLPGSSINEVYQDVRTEYHNAWKLLKRLTHSLSGQVQPVAGIVPGKFTLMNSNLAVNREPVLVHTERTGKFIDVDNHELKAQLVASGYILDAPVKGFNNALITFIAQDERQLIETKVITGGGNIETKHYIATWNENGQFTRIFDRDNDREVLSGFGNVLMAYEDRPVEFDAWNVDADYVDKGEALTSTSARVTVNGPLTTVEIEFLIASSKINQVVTFSDWSRRIDFDTHVDWHEHQTLLRTAFDLNVHTDSATYDIQYGNIRRSIAANTSWQAAQFEVIGHKWADLSQRDYGVALMNDSKYGYAAKGNQLSLSLLTSGVFPDPEADQGAHHFKYALLPHTGDFVVGKVETAAMAFNNPVTVVQDNQVDKPLFEFSGTPLIEIDAVKISENGQQVILRFHDYSGSTQNVNVCPRFRHGVASRVRLDETPEESLNLIADMVSMQIKPYEIVTLAFEKKD